MTTIYRHYAVRRSTLGGWAVTVTTVEGAEVGNDTIARFPTRAEARRFAATRNHNAQKGA